MHKPHAKLIEAEEIGLKLLEEVEARELIAAGKTEEQLSDEVFDLARELFGIEKHWHKRIVRTGANTLLTYYENPPNLTIQDDDVLFFDFGPLLEDWEADLGRTYVVGNDPYKVKLKNDVEAAWHEANAWFHQQTSLTGSQFWDYVMDLTSRYGWTYPNNAAAHIIGKFPHEKLEKEDYSLYAHKDNHADMFAPDSDGTPRGWILEIHFVDVDKGIGGFYEQLLR